MACLLSFVSVNESINSLKPLRAFCCAHKAVGTMHYVLHRAKICVFPLVIGSTFQSLNEFYTEFKHSILGHYWALHQ